jgi:DNA-binding transcriptional MocR family regulator
MTAAPASKSAQLAIPSPSSDSNRTVPGRIARADGRLRPIDTPSLTQFRRVPGVIDLGWGLPDPDLLPVAELRAAATRALDRYGTSAIEYGSPAGPPPLIDFIGSRLALTDARAPAPAEVLVTAGASQAIDLAASLVVRPGDTVLVDVPTYHLAMKILRDRPVTLVGVPSDAEGILVDELASAVADLRRRGERPRLLYTIVTFRNPTGSVLPAQRRAALLAAAEEHALRIVEDDTYRELAYDGPAPPSLWAEDRAGVVLRAGSFSKSVAPGLRVGYLTAPGAEIEALTTSGLLDSGGGTTHFAGTVLAEYAAAGDYVTQVERFQAAYRERRDALLGSLEEHLPDGTTWTRAGGGYFCWVTLPPGVDVTAVAAAASARQMEFIPARAFFVDRSAAPDALRLAFSMYGPADLAEAGRRLGAAVREAVPG